MQRISIAKSSSDDSAKYVFQARWHGDDVDGAGYGTVTLHSNSLVLEPSEGQSGLVVYSTGTFSNCPFFRHKGTRLCGACADSCLYRGSGALCEVLLTSRVGLLWVSVDTRGKMKNLQS